MYYPLLHSPPFGRRHIFWPNKHNISISMMRIICLISTECWVQLQKCILSSICFLWYQPFSSLTVRPLDQHFVMTVMSSSSPLLGLQQRPIQTVLERKRSDHWENKIIKCNCSYKRDGSVFEGLLPFFLNPDTGLYVTPHPWSNPMLPFAPWVVSVSPIGSYDDLSPITVKTQVIEQGKVVEQYIIGITLSGWLRIWFALSVG